MLLRTMNSSSRPGMLPATPPSRPCTLAPTLDLAEIVDSAHCYYNAMQQLRQAGSEVRLCWLVSARDRQRGCGGASTPSGCSAPNRGHSLTHDMHIQLSLAPAFLPRTLQIQQASAF